jgi:hypothetical protein
MNIYGTSKKFHTWIRSNGVNPELPKGSYLLFSAAKLKKLEKS